MSIKIEPITPIVPEVGKGYYAAILGLSDGSEGNYHLVKVEVRAIGLRTISVNFTHDGYSYNRTYRNGDVELVEAVA